MYGEKLIIFIEVIYPSFKWENLPIYQQLYNESPHSSLGKQSPFKVYYGRQPNSVRNKLSLGERKAFEVSEEHKTEFQLKSPKKDALRQ